MGVKNFSTKKAGSVKHYVKHQEVNLQMPLEQLRAAVESLTEKLTRQGIITTGTKKALKQMQNNTNSN